MEEENKNGEAENQSQSFIEQNAILQKEIEGLKSQIAGLNRSYSAEHQAKEKLLNEVSSIKSESEKSVIEANKILLAEKYRLPDNLIDLIKFDNLAELEDNIIKLKNSYDSKIQVGIKKGVDDRIYKDSYVPGNSDYQRSGLKTKQDWNNLSEIEQQLRFEEGSKLQDDLLKGVK